MAEIVSVEEWLYSKLNAVAGITGVYSDRAPLTATFPYIVWQLQPGGRDIGTVSASTIYVDGDWLIKVVGKTNSVKSLETINDAIHTAIHKQSGAPVLMCVREQVFYLSEFVDGEMYKHLGGFYRVICQ